ncbi:unnamed protein product, partial [Closterium sp. NIES-53]
IAPEGDPDAPNIPTPRSYAEAIEGPYSSQLQAAMDAEMASLKFTGTYVDEVPPRGANIVSGMWIFKVKRPPSSPPAFKARYVARVHRAWGSCLEDGLDLSSLITLTPPGSSSEAEIYAGAMAAQELRWLTYLLTDLGEAPRSPPVLYVDNKAMLALCQEHRLEHRTKHIALRYFLARELQQRGQLRLAYVASQANTADVFTKALQPCDHQHDAWRADFGDKAKRLRWAELLRSGVAISDLDYDAILAAMYALSLSAEGDSYLYVPPDPGIEAAALGASESALLGTAPADALHTFTLDSGASRYFFRDITTLTPLFAPVPVRLADPSRGPIFARSSTVLPCPVVPSGSLSGLHLPSFSMNMVSTAALQDAMVTATTPGGQRVSFCTCTRTGRHLATFTRRPGSSLYTLATEPSQVAASAQVSALGPVAPPCSCRLLSHQTLLWYRRPRHPSLPRLRGMQCRLLFSGLPRSLPPLPPSPAPPRLPCIEGQHNAALHSSFPPTKAPLQTLHMDMWGPAGVSGQGRERYFLLSVSSSASGSARTFLSCVRTLTEVVSSPPTSFHGEGILQSFTLPASPQQNRISEETSPTLRWTGKVGDASVFQVWGSRAFVRDTFADKISACAIPCVFLGFPPGAPGWQFYHPTSRRVFPSQNVTFDEPPPPSGPAPSGVSQVDPLPCTVLVEVAFASGAARGAASGDVESRGAEPRGAESKGAGSGGAEPGGAELGGAEPWGAEPGGAEPAGVEPGGAEPEGVERGGAVCEGAESGGAEPRAARAGDSAVGDTGARGVGATRLGGPGVIAGAGGTAGVAAAGPGGAGTRGVGAGGVGAGGTGAGGAGAGEGGAGDTGADGAGAGGTGAVGARAGGDGAGDTGARNSTLTPSPASPDPESRPASPVRAVCTGRRVPRLRPPPLPGTHAMALCPSSVPLRVPLTPPLESSLPVVPDPESVLARADIPTVSHLLATLVTDPSFESTAASALVAELVDFAAACRLDYATALVAESEFASPPSVGGECALRTAVLEVRQEDFECLAATVPHLMAMLLAPEGDPDAPDIPTLCSYAEAITGPYSSQWQRAMDAEMASWKSTGTYVDAFPPSGLHVDFQRLHLRLWGLLLRLPPPFYVLVYVDDLVFATCDTEALTLVKSELQKRHTCTDLGPSAFRLLVLLATSHSFVYQSLALSSTFGQV